MPRNVHFFKPSLSFEMASCVVCRKGVLGAPFWSKTKQTCQESDRLSSPRVGHGLAESRQNQPSVPPPSGQGVGVAGASALFQPKGSTEQLRLCSVS